MATTTAGYEWTSSPPHRRSPDIPSPHYPHRVIRPLPKRRLRSKLSPEQAQSIVYPPAPPTTTPLFTFPYGPMEKPQHVPTNPHTCGPLRGGACAECHGEHSELESEEEDDDRRVTSPSPSGGMSQYDSYDSFENTNNKKKRKIPLSGNASSHHTNLSAEMASMGISSNGDPAVNEDGGAGVGQYYGTGASAVSAAGSSTGISGAGRGRYGRSATRAVSGRQPLGALSNGPNVGAFSGSSSARTRRDWSGTQTNKGAAPSQGIISEAIRNAAEQGLASPQNGNENVSLLQREASRPAPKNTQFTFTCGSDSANKMVWPGRLAPSSGSSDEARSDKAWPSSSAHPNMSSSHTNPPPPPTTYSRRVATQGTQTSPNMNGAPQPPSSYQQPPQSAASDQQAPQPPKKSRRRPDKVYALAARERRLKQEYQNYHSPPTRESIWICEFCEYEAIFGCPPAALVRQYEIKDRKQRRQEAERRRLLEKAKMKARKGKKNGKSAGKAAATTNQQMHPPPPESQRYDQHPGNVADGQGEEYYDEDVEETNPSTRNSDNVKVNGHYADGQTALPGPAPPEHSVSANANLRSTTTAPAAALASTPAGTNSA